MEFSIDLSLNNVGLVRWENGVIQEMLLLRNDKEKYPKGTLKTEILANKILKIIEFLNANVFLCSEVVYIEKPSGSQSASGMINYTVETAIYSFLRSKCLNVVWVKPTEAKEALTGNKNAEKEEMIKQAYYLYPNKYWLKDKNDKLYNYNEHLADAIAIYLGGKRFHNFIERYENMTDSNWFKNSYENKSVGDMMKIE